MEIKKAIFIKGIIEEDSIMYDKTPRIAFIGRSNVGKSTTINSILKRKKLVKTGKTPGKTREINFFNISTVFYEKLYFVDLPGYGYAKLSKNDRLKLEKMIKWYVTSRLDVNELIVLIIDAKAGLTDFDKQMINLIYENKKKFILAINKIDKINQKILNNLKKDIEAYIPNLLIGKNVFYYSALKNKNINILRQFLLT